MLLVGGRGFPVNVCVHTEGVLLKPMNRFVRAEDDQSSLQIGQEERATVNSKVGKVLAMNIC